MLPFQILRTRKPVVAGGGAVLTLVGIDTSGAAINIATGAIDFATWGAGNGLTPAETKSGGGSTLSMAIYGGLGSSVGYPDDPRTISYSGSTPTGSGSNTFGVYNDANDALGGTLTGFGFTWIFPAGTTQQRARIPFGAYSAVLQYTASLSDASASPLAGSSILTAGGGTVASGDITIDYKAASGGQTLSVNIFVQSCTAGYGNIGGQGANYA